MHTNERKKIRVSVVAMTTKDDRSKNLDEAEALVRRAAKAGARWVILPEVFVFSGDYADLYKNAEREGEDVARRFSNLARELKIVLFCGSMGERAFGQSIVDGEKRVYNTSYVFGEDGSTLAKYRKVHLFNLKDAAGNHLYCESDGYLSGNQSCSFEVDGWRVGLVICYDLRFGEFFWRMNRERPHDVFVIPSAFTKKTGEAHWELLLRARAVELQAYVLGANQVGEHRPGKESFGHSMIVDPWGEVLANTGPEIGVVDAELSKDRIQEVRDRLPALANRRPELY